jgi:hypothetical protein
VRAANAGSGGRSACSAVNASLTTFPIVSTSPNPYRIAADSATTSARALRGASDLDAEAAAVKRTAEMRTFGDAAQIARAAACCAATVRDVVHDVTSARATSSAGDDATPFEKKKKKKKFRKKSIFCDFFFLFSLER